MINLPRLYTASGEFVRPITVISTSLTQNIIPLSTATITLPKGESIPMRTYVEIFYPYGSAGMFRVRSPRDAYGQETTTVELEHMISEVGDYIVKEEISEMVSAASAMQRVFKHYKGSKWKLGSVSALGNGKIALEAKYERVLDVMLSILEQKKDCMMDFDFTTSPWTVKIVKKGTAVAAEGRLARNVSSAVITYDDTELCTRVWYQTFDKNKKATWKYKDADTKATWGLVEGTVRTSSDMTDDEVMATVDAYISDHKNPRISVRIQGVELCQITKESMDKLTIGNLYRLALPDYGTTVEDNITSLVWNDIYGSPTSVSVNLGAEEDTVVTFLHNLDSKGSGGGGGGKAKDKQEAEWSEYIVQWDKLDDSIAGMVAKQDRQGNILEQAGLTLNSKGLLVYAKTERGLYHQFDVLNNSFTSKINNATAGLESEISQLDDQIKLKVSKGSVCSEINLEPGLIKIKADCIDIDGLVDNLTSYNVNVETLTTSNTATFGGEVTFNGGADFASSDVSGIVNLTADDGTFDTVEATDSISTDGTISADGDITSSGKVTGASLKVGSYDASWEKMTVVTGVERSVSRNFVYAVNGNISNLSTVIGTLCTGVSSDTIYYLGR